MAWQSVLLLAGYVWLVPVLVLGPLAGLLLMSRPRTTREWIWIVVAVSSSLVWLAQQGNLAGQVLRAAAVLLTGAYVALTLWRLESGWARAIQATVIAGAALAVLMVWASLGLSELRQAAANIFRPVVLALPVALRAHVPALPEYLGALFPVLLAIVGVGGVQLAWAWHCRLAERPVGERLCTGEFNL